ncbi:right-handed parallel beta-helix repeat-containing protein [Halobacteria archaeon AArc-m2/3/4]|uniref:Right-handed parallel beta-helix repeat-containing protein n=1 Tax=Natronoglomus mannanivorans TaxID=2979990 RepID=A0AAP2YZQ3_9EURY|nr:right-handed parallel beta-helix repeat-containing protein [Halobacteria archaeon AArc-xg1-1]MCU4971950.1 right-handed parallel beta-helix repeat-containing protein [Halobacteria archaeon AArc-m2/3/4]
MSITEDASRDRPITAAVIALVGTLLVLGIGVGIAVGAGGDAIDTQADEPTAIDSCTEIDTAGEYELASNLTNRSTCLEITESDVIVDGAGYGIGSYGAIERDEARYGVHVNDTENVTVRNVSVAGWGSNDTGSSDDAAGIAFENVIGGAVDDVAAFENEDGIRFDNATGNTVTNVTATENFAGVSLWDSNGNTVANVTATENTDGIALWDSSGNAVVHNTVSGNYYNVVLGNAHWNTIGDTSATGGDYGLFLQASHRNTVSNVSATDTADGIVLERSSGNTLTANTVAGSGSGIVLESSSHLNTLEENELHDNVEGISVTAASHRTTLTENTVESLDWDLTIDNSSETDVTDLELGDETVSVDGENVRLRSSGGDDVDTDAGADVDTQAPPNHGAVGPAFELEATNGSSAVNLTTSYTGAGLGDVDEETVGFWWLDDDATTWERVDESTVDVDNRTVSVSLGESELASESESEADTDTENENETAAEYNTGTVTGTIAVFGLETYDLTVSVEEDGDPVTNTTTIEVVNTDTDGVVAIQTISDGTATFDLQTGTYEVTADANGYDLVTETIAVDGDAADLTLDLERDGDLEAENESAEG